MQAKYVTLTLPEAPRATLGAETASRTTPETLPSNQRRFSPEIRTSPPVVGLANLRPYLDTPENATIGASSRSRNDLADVAIALRMRAHTTRRPETPDPEQHVRVGTLRGRDSP